MAKGGAPKRGRAEIVFSLSEPFSLLVSLWVFSWNFGLSKAKVSLAEVSLAEVGAKVGLANGQFFERFWPIVGLTDARDRVSRLMFHMKVC